ncbi:MAG: SMP-30/gluconolactonase/LRE family protein [Alphaproteobacteria bacterium]
MKISRIGNIRCKVGEGPLWNADEQALYFVDIQGKQLHRHDAASDRIASWSLPLKIGCVAMRRSGGAMLALEDGFYAFDFATGTPEAFAKPEDDKTQFNDGKVDRQGRFLAGTVCRSFTDPKPEASLYRLNPDRTIARLATDIFIFNGPAWSPDGRVFYFADSQRGCLFACEYDLRTGAISNRRTFVDVTAVGGSPDGGTVDAEGCYWTSVVMAGKIACFTPDGRLRRTVDVPVPWPSSLMFGGPNLDRLYFTSIDGAVYGRPTTPDSGGLFLIDGLGVTGIAEARFSG